MFNKLTIDSIAARAVLVPMSRPLRTAACDVPAAPLVLVDVHTNEGIVGRSYAFAFAHRGSALGSPAAASHERRYPRAPW